MYCRETFKIVFKNHLNDIFSVSTIKQTYYILE
jgi:hypothetical protein